MSNLHAFIAELKRRHVLRVLVGYAAIGFATVSIASDFLPALRLPEWTVTLVAALVVLGLPIALVLAWAFDITPDGVRRAEPGAPRAARPLRPRSAVGYLGVGILVALVGFGGYAQVQRLSDDDSGVSEIRTVAVMPFENMTDDPTSEHLSDGLTEEVSMQLYKLEGLTVKSRTSTVMYKGRGTAVEQVGKELGVQALVEGSFRRSGEVVRVVAKLVDARSGEQLWAGEYDRQLQDLVRMQVDIAEQIASALHVRLSPEAKRQFAARRNRPVNPDAYEQYMLGLALSGEGKMEEGIAAYEVSIQLDPNDPAPHAGIARNLFFTAFFGGASPTDVLPRMRDAAARALELDPGYADAYGTLALYYLHYKWDWEQADQYFRRALEVSPNAAQVRHDYAHYLLAVGRTEEGAAQSARAAELDPGNTMLTACAGWHGFTDREYDGAVKNSMAALMMMPGMFWPELILGWAYEQKGQYPQAVATLRNAVTHSSGLPFAVASLAHALGRSGQEGAARKLLGDLLDQSSLRYVSAYDIAIIYAGLDDHERTLVWLRRAYAERSAWLVNIAWEPRFDRLRDDPRFTAITANMRLPVPDGQARAPAPATQRS